MKVHTLCVGVFQTNCYIVESDKCLIIIDPGAAYRRIKEKIDELNKPLAAIFLTHGHFDHIGAVDSLYKEYTCPIYASQQDLKMLQNEKYNNLAGFSATVKSPINFLQCNSIDIEDLKIDILYTPGHSDGSLMFIIENCLFSGDTLFKGSVGRTDLYSGSSGKLMQSLQCLYTLDDSMLVYPGHEAPTTIYDELRTNPYLQ